MEFSFSVLVGTTVPDPGAYAVHLERATAGGFHTCAEGSDGRAYCWGDNRFGQVGDATSVDRRSVPTPVAVPEGVTLSDIVAGHFHTCADGSDGQLYCWGQNQGGQVGDGSFVNQLAPVAVSSPGGVTLSRPTAGDYHTCANGSDGRVYCWGSNFWGNLGSGSGPNKPTPVAVIPPSGVRLSDPVAGGAHACAVNPAGRLYCWGNNSASQVGDGTRTDRLTPVIIAGMRGN